MFYLKAFPIAFTVFLIIDLIWLGFIAKNFYRDQIGFLMSENINWYAAIAFYCLYIFGIIIFVLEPALTERSLMHAVIYGAFFGLVCYATYDLTNLATVKDWPLLVTVVDLIWGMVLSGSIAGISYVIVGYFHLGIS